MLPSVADPDPTLENTLDPDPTFEIKKLDPDLIYILKSFYSAPFFPLSLSIICS